MTNTAVSRMNATSAAEVPEDPRSLRSESPAPRTGVAFDSVYDQHVDFVWRCARRLGIPETSLEDVTQDVFLVVHRRLGHFDGRVQVRGWLFGIVAKVVRDYRRRFRRKGAACVAYDEATDAQISQSAEPSVTPHAVAEHYETVRVLYELLDELDEEKREVWMLAQLEEMSMPEIAECLGINVNTVAARLRAARRRFAEAHTRYRARTERRRT
jgi:RNA polymerase sigma-70 factor (ECF subfamily)